MTDHEILGVEPPASAEEVREAYLFLVGKFHPDANPGREQKAAEHFRKVQEAYDRIRHGRSPPGGNQDKARAPPPPSPPVPAPAAAPKAVANCSMDELIEKVVADYQPDKGKAVAKSIGMSILKIGVMNALTLPFGRVSVGWSTYKPLTKDQYRARVRAALYPKVLETKYGKKAEWFGKMISSYNKASIDAKTQILVLALKEPEKYIKWVLTNLP